MFLIRIPPLAFRKSASFTGPTWPCRIRPASRSRPAGGLDVGRPPIRDRLATSLT